MFSLIFFLGTLQLFALVLFNDEISNNTAEAVLNYNVFFFKMHEGLLHYHIDIFVFIATQS